MTGDTDQPLWRAIAVGLDASPLSLAGLRAAESLARRLGGSVTVRTVCIADTDIARLADHPGAVAVCSLTARARPMALSRESIQAGLSGQIRAARAAVEEARARLIEAERAAAKATGAEAEAEADAEAEARAAEAAARRLGFQERHGPVTRELRAFAEESGADLVVLGWTGRTRAPWRRGGPLPLGSTARALVEAAPGRALLVLRAELTPETPLLVPFDGAPGTRGALAAACVLAGGAAAPAERVAVLLLGDGHSLRAQAQEITEAAGVRARFHDLPPATPDRLVRATGFPQALLVLSDELLTTFRLSTPGLLDRLSCSVLLLR